MTLVFYISPPETIGDPNAQVTPFLAADIVSTFNLPKSVFDSLSDISPGSINNQNHRFQSRRRLVRKLNVIGNIALACCGRADIIKAFLQDVKFRSDEIHQSPRPMRIIGDIADNYVLHYDSGFRAVGASIDGQKINTLVSESDFSRNFGRFNAQGSGLHDFNEYLQEFDKSDRDSLPRIFRGISFINSLNCTNITEEFSGSIRNNWGGYVEYVFSSGGRWVFGQNTMHLFMIVTHQSNAPFRILPKVILYKSDLERGSIMTFSGSDSFQFNIRSPLDDREDAGEFDESWIGWQPECATITMIFPVGTDRHAAVTRTIPFDEKCYCTIQRDTFHFGVEDDITMGMFESTRHKVPE